MTSPISGNATATFARTHQQPTDKMKAKIAADARALPSRAEVEAEAGKRQAEFETKRAEFDRQAKFFELESLQVQKDIAIDMARGRDSLLAHYEKMASIPPEPAQVLEGAEAKKAWELADEYSKASGHDTFPPAGDMTYIFVSDGYQYNIRGDGYITKRKEGVRTPEEYESFMRDFDETRRRQPAFVAEKKAEIAEFDSRMTALRSELGLTEDTRGKDSARGEIVSIKV